MMACLANSDPLTRSMTRRRFFTSPSGFKSSLLSASALQDQKDHQSHDKKDSDLCSRRAERRGEISAVTAFPAGVIPPPTFAISSIHNR